MMRFRFGYLPYKWSLKFNGGAVSPISTFDKVKVYVDAETNPDGFFYPPLSHLERLDPMTKKSLGVVPRTKRPARFYLIRPSHELRLYASGTREDVRNGPAAFIVHLLAYYFGVRLQFRVWLFDGRIPIQSTHNINHSVDTAENLLSQCYLTWQRWPREDQKLITNVLYMHSRAPSYEWDWERFTIEYMVLDACYKLANRRHGVHANTHRDRINTLCRRFNVPVNLDVIKDVVQLRNDLFHEALWDGSQPCTTISSSALQRTLNLRKLNQRLIPALLDYRTAYVQTKWWSRGAHLFYKP